MEMEMTLIKAPAEISATDDWAADNAAGRELAAAWISEIRRLDSLPAFAALLQSLSAAGRWTGVEVGFAFALGAAVLGRQRV